MRYNHLNDFYKEKFSSRTLKICIDGGFTCPNRDGKKGIGGCIFCGERGSGDLLNRISIKEQVETFLSSYKGDRAEKFIVYFQNFTNTYADIDTLKYRYDSALIDERIVGIDIDTRPDCITEDVCKLLASYKEKYYVVVELGLQTSNEETHKKINQGITNKDFIYAISLLNRYKIDAIVHLMVGLPGENHTDILNTVSFLKDIKYSGIKIHSTYVLKDTKLEKMFRDGEYKPLTYDEYLDEVLYILTHISKDVVVHRITGDPPKDLLVEPLWALNKKTMLNSIEKIMEVEGLYQGCNY